MLNFRPSFNVTEFARILARLGIHDAGEDALPLVPILNKIIDRLDAIEAKDAE